MRLSKDKMLSNIEHQDESLEQSKARLAVQKERARLGMCNLRQQRRVEEPREQRETGLAVDRESKKRRLGKDLPEQRETRFDAERESKKEGVSRNYQSNVITGLRLKEIMPKESVPKNHKNNLKTDLTLKEIYYKKCQQAEGQDISWK